MAVATTNHIINKFNAEDLENAEIRGVFFKKVAFLCTPPRSLCLCVK